MTSRRNRDTMIIATKVGSEMGPGQKGLSRAYVTRALDASLRRLATDHVDLYFSHWEDPDTPLEETLGTYADLVAAGKVRVVGASNHSVATMSEALEISRRNGWPRFEVLQTHYNLYDRRGFEADLERFCRENDVGVTSYFSLAKGFLSGKYRSEEDFSKSAARGGNVAAYLNPRGLRILSALDAVASAHRKTPAAVAIAWLLTRPVLTAAISSATSPEQLRELVAATELSLTPAQIAQLDEASREG
jgi:aryl-alcohol dehydrogenase-like predicted oxidoreductase